MSTDRVKRVALSVVRNRWYLMQWYAMWWPYGCMRAQYRYDRAIAILGSGFRLEGSVRLKF